MIFDAIALVVLAAMMLVPLNGRKCALGTRASATVPQGKNQRWSLDFVPDTSLTGAASVSRAFVDDCTRESLALVADTSLSGHRVARELDGLIAQCGRPAMVVIDNVLRREVWRLEQQQISIR